MGEENPQAGQRDASSDQGAVAVSGASEVKSSEDPLEFLDVAAKRQFSESEISQAITIRFLVEKVKELKADNVYLKPFEGKFYQYDRDLQVERNKTKLGKVQEIVSSALLTVGGVGMGIAVKFFDKDIGVSIAAFVIFAGVVASGFYLKVGSR
jgi:hypothetical protein